MILITAVLMLLTWVEWELGPLRVVFAIVLVAIMPGLALTTAIFIQPPLNFVEKLAVSIGLSLGLVALGGILLHFTALGVQTTSWALFLGGITIIANGVALARTAATRQVDSTLISSPVRIPQLILVFLAGLIMVGAFLTAQAGAVNRPVPGYTQLWMVWQDESQQMVILGLQNREKESMRYRLQLSTKQGNVAEWSDITLESGERWQIEYTPPANVTEKDTIRATLYRLDAPDESYRDVYLRRTAP
jgi:uncharacterized membrane protein